MEVGTPLGKGKCFHFYYFKDLDFFQIFNFFLFACKLFVACLLLATSDPTLRHPPAPPPG